MAATGGAVDVAPDLDQLDLGKADLLVAELPSDPAPLVSKLKAMGPNAAALVVVDKPDLMLLVEQLKIPSVTAVMVKDYVTPMALTGVVARLLRGNIFGIAKILPWGTRVYSEIVGSHDDRLQALASLSRFTTAMKLRAKYREAIDIVADELLMNGLYDAPIDAQGQAVFGDVAPGQRSSVRLERPAVLQFASDGARVALAVRDSFGSLNRKSVLTNLERCALEGEQIDRKTAGAGLGLYLVANHVSELSFNVLPGVATEVACVVDFKVPKQQLKHFGFYEELVQGAEKGGTRGEARLVSSGQRSQPQAGSNKVVHLTLIVALLLLVVAGLLMAWPYIHKPPKGSLKIVTNPSGAVVRVNGIRSGVADPHLMIKDVDAKQVCNITATLAGHTEAQEVVRPKRDQTLEVKLKLEPMRAKLRISSSPLGAQIMINGKDSGQKTPTVLEDLEPGKTLAVVMKKHGFSASAGSVKPLASQTLIYHAELSLAGDFAMIGLTSDPPGARLLVNDVDTGEVTPIPGFVVRGGQQYKLKLLLKGRVPWTHTWSARVGSRLVKDVKLVEGGRLTLTANTPAVAVIGDRRYRLPLREALVPSGSFNVRLRAGLPYLDQQLRLTIDPGQALTRQLIFGFVKVTPKKWRIRLKGARPVSRVALKPGAHTITIVNRKGERRETEVQVKPRATVTIDALKLAPPAGIKAPRKRPTKRPPAKKPTPAKPAKPAAAIP